MKPAMMAGAVLLLLGDVVHAQTIYGNNGLSPFASSYKVDFAIPDAPAFKLLNSDGSTILRPGTPGEITTALSQFHDADGDIGIPKALALEVSPALLISGPRLSVAGYRAKKLLYATRFSVGTGAATDTAGRAVAFGLRIGIVNEADLRLDDSFLNDTSLQITPITKRINDIRQAARDAVGPLAPLTLTDAQKAAIDSLTNVIKERWAARYWNARALDVGFGVKATTLDADGADPTVTTLGFWATYGLGFGSWGQLLTGVRIGGDRNRGESGFNKTLGAAARLYMGTNAYKAFVEVQDEAADGAGPALLFNSGGELRLDQWFWVSGSVGIASSGDSKGQLKSSLKLKTAFPRTYQ